MSRDEIAAVVIGRNEGERLLKCLRSARSEVDCIIYVDSGSTDGSVQAAEQLGAYVVGLDMARPFTAARARNEGFAAIKVLRPGISFIQFIDGDCELIDGWLQTAAKFMHQRNDVAVACGRRRELCPSASIYNLLCDIEWDTPVGETAACGGDALVRVEAFGSVGGFNSQLIAGEEPELCLRLREKGWSIWRLDVEMTRHDAAMTRFGQWWRRTVRWGFALAEVSKLHWRSPFAIWKKALASAIFWAALLPALIGLAAIMHHAALAIVLIYPLQVCRIAIARRPVTLDSWICAAFMVLGKFAELLGILKFYWRTISHRSVRLIEYK
jgi:glycosyltransferase involved in cell wall biosynthesis